MSSTICMDQRLLHSDMKKDSALILGASETHGSSRVKLKMACFDCTKYCNRQICRGPYSYQSRQRNNHHLLRSSQHYFYAPKHDSFNTTLRKLTCLFLKCTRTPSWPWLRGILSCHVGRDTSFYMMELRTRRHRGILCFLMLVACKWCV